jgi:hypothetical protein
MGNSVGMNARTLAIDSYYLPVWRICVNRGTYGQTLLFHIFNEQQRPQQPARYFIKFRF